MNIEKDRVVSFHYVLRDAEGAEVERSGPDEPMLYLHGHEGIVPGLEAAMSGRAAGDRFTVTLSAEEGYGPRHADALQRIPMKAVMTRGKLKPGQVIAVNTEHGPRQVTVVKAGKFVVDVDVNHPLAGRALSFEVEIVDVREASAEEKAHRHAHGPGHHHH
ncbi:MAG: peptidylprolyl isomerase [Gammaproteobacteria bacterium]|nr:peptidylprolyl isomerase [Gammaproteobacteria bacterium]MCP5201136.1 peptidylprolyl isomerase [Gammaproteobacteria bacterium]